MTAAQLRALRIIAKLWDAHGYPPSLREISNAAGWSSLNSVSEHLARLKRDGLVNFVSGQARTITVTALGRESLR